MHECASAESWPAAVSRAWRLQGQIDRALAWSDSQHGVRPASHRGLTLNSAQKGAKASRLNCRSAAVPHESDGARELRMALSGCVNRSSEPAASRKRSFRLPQTHRAKRRGQPANPERRRYLRADSFSGSQRALYIARGPCGGRRYPATWTLGIETKAYAWTEIRRESLRGPPI